MTAGVWTGAAYAVVDSTGRWVVPLGNEGADVSPIEIGLVVLPLLKLSSKRLEAAGLLTARDIHGSR